MNFLKKIYEGKFDEEVHNRFIRYGRGKFERLYLSIERSGEKLKIKTSFDFANSLFGIIAENIKEAADVKGKIVAARDFKNELNFEIKNYSKRGRIYTAEIEGTLNPQTLKTIYEKFKYNFILLNVRSKDFRLTTKQNIPKPGGKIQEDFCSAVLPSNLIDEFAFDFDPNFKTAKIKHEIIIEEIEIPKEYENDPEKARIHAIRKGKLIRIANVDGKEYRKEMKLVA